MSRLLPTGARINGMDRDLPSTDTRRSHAGVCNGATRPECHFFKRVTVSAQRAFVLSAAIDIVEYHSRKPAFRRASQIFDVNNTRRGNGARHAIHMASLERIATFSNTEL